MLLGLETAVSHTAVAIGLARASMAVRLPLGRMDVVIGKQILGLINAKAVWTMDVMGSNSHPLLAV